MGTLCRALPWPPASINGPIHFSDSLHQFFAATLSFFQFDHRKQHTLSSCVYGVSCSAHRSATGFRINFL
jgi:hypothetical protein